jgi:hypothetical protein
MRFIPFRRSIGAHSVGSHGGEVVSPNMRLNAHYNLRKMYSMSHLYGGRMRTWGYAGIGAFGSVRLFTFDEVGATNQADKKSAPVTLPD